MDRRNAMSLERNSQRRDQGYREPRRDPDAWGERRRAMRRQNKGRYQSVRRKRRRLWPALVGVAAVGGAILLFFRYPWLCVLSSVTVEAGEKAPSLERYLRWKDEKARLLSGVQEGTELDHVNNYEIVVGIGEAEVNTTLYVVDTVPPRMELKERTVYVGEKIPIEDFVASIVDATICNLEYKEEPPWEEAGSHTITLSATDEGGNRTEATTTLEIVEDTTPPQITGVAEMTITEGDVIPYTDGIQVTDNCDAHVELEVDSGSADRNVPGDYEVVYRATDKAGNLTEVKTILHVKSADNIAPKITGVKELTVVKGGSVSYKRDVTVTDNVDEKVSLEVDASAVDLDKPGDYPVLYSATDKAGNRAEQSTVLHVVEARAGGVEITEEAVLEKADQILDSILSNGMSDYEKLRAIYDYAHNKISYADETPKTTWVEGAYYGLVLGKGDCYAYAMAAKCLLTRAGITNMDIERVPEGSYTHFWNLVDIGEGWHHFDTCRRADGSTFFYLTDAELMAYSESHISSTAPKGTHYYDRTLYPEIP